MRTVFLLSLLLTGARLFAHGDHHTYIVLSTNSASIEMTVSLPYHLLQMALEEDNCEVSIKPGFCAHQLLMSDFNLSIEQIEGVVPELLEASREEDRVTLFYSLPLPRNAINELEIETGFLTGLPGGGHRYLKWISGDRELDFLLPDDGSSLKVEL